MSIEDFKKLITNVENSGNDPDVREMLYEEYIRYIAKGGVNPYHARKIAILIRDSMSISKKSPQ